MAAELTTLEDGTIKLTITIPLDQIQKTREEVMAEVKKSANIPGFRKGMAPADLVEKSADEAKIREEILKKLLPTSYIAAVEEHKLRPILNPKIHVETIEEGKDWTYVAETCEMPEIKLGDYKKKIQDINAKSKIIVPGQEDQPTGEAGKQTNFEDIVNVLLETVTLNLPSIIVEQETDRLLSQTLNEIKSLGLSLDQYLGSTGKSIESLREEYKLRAKNDITVEFTLQKIAEEEKLTVGEQEVKEALAQAKDDRERESLQANQYLLASILRQQKTLDFLKSL